MPTVTNIVQNKKNKNFYSIFIDNKHKFSLSLNDLNYLNLKIGDEISNEKLNFLINEYEFEKAKRYVYKILSQKAYSEKAIIEKLKSKKYNEKIIQKIIEELKHYNYINDQTLIYEYAKSKIEQKPMGRYRLEKELYNKKFNKDLIKECISQIYNEYNERELALKALILKFRDLPENFNKDFVRKVYNFLLSRGFSYEIINEIINKKSKFLDNDYF